MELGNIFNRSFWNNPTATNATAPQTRLPNGNAQAGFGFINNSTVAVNPRQGQAVVQQQNVYIPLRAAQAQTGLALLAR